MKHLILSSAAILAAMTVSAFADDADKPSKEKSDERRPGIESREKDPGKNFERPGKPERPWLRKDRRPEPDMENAMLVGILDNKKMSEDILLTAEQRSNLEAAFKTADSELETTGKKLDEAVKKQADAVKAENPDTDAVMAQVDEVWKLRGEIAKIQTRKMLALRKELTAEQLARAKKIINEQRREMTGRWRRGQEGDRPGMNRGKDKDRDGKPGKAERKDGEGRRSREGDRPGRTPPERPDAHPEAGFPPVD